MNKIFKIVFNAARGKMMVVNEATSSVQTGKKAAVTVAVIGALAAGSAMAAVQTNDFTGGDITIDNSTSTPVYGVVFDKASVVNDSVTYNVTVNETKTGTLHGAVAVGQSYGKLAVDGKADLTFEKDVSIDVTTNATRNMSGTGATQGLVIYQGETNVKGNASVKVVSTGGEDKTKGSTSVAGVDAWGDAYKGEAVIKFSGDTATVIVEGNDATVGTDKSAGAVQGIIATELGTVLVGSNTTLNVTATSKGKADNGKLGSGLNGATAYGLSVIGGGQIVVSGDATVTAISEGGNAYALEANRQGHTGNMGSFEGDPADIQLKGSKVNLVAEAGDIARAAWSTNGASITLGQSESAVDVRAKAEYYALGLNSTQKNSSLNVVADTLDVTVHSAQYAAGILSSSNVGANVEKLALEDRNKITVKANQINVNATSDDAKSAVGLAAYSQGYLDVVGNLTVNATNAIEARGAAIVNVGQKGETVKLTGDIAFDFYSDNSRDNTNATVNVKLSGADSFLHGNITHTSSGSVTPTPEQEKVTGMTLSIEDKAEWTATANSFVNRLVLNDGVVNVTNGSTVEVDIALSGESGTIGLSSDSDVFKVTGTNSLKSLKITQAGATADTMTATEAEAAAKLYADNVIGSDGKALESMFVVAEGEVGGAIVVGANGAVQAVNAKTEALAEQVTLAPQMITRIMMNDVRKRMGDLRAAEGTHGAWVRYNGGQMAGSGVEADFNMIQVGVDTVPVADAPRFGVAFSYAQTEAEDKAGLATTDMDSFSLAFYGTKMYDNGMFVDVIGRMATMDTEMNVLGKPAKMDNIALSVSGELGWRFDVTDRFFFEPSVEATYTYTNADMFMMGSGKYELEAVDSLVGRAGFAAGMKCPGGHGDLYVRAAVAHEFMGDSTMNSWTARGTQVAPVVMDGKDTWFEYAIGVNLNVNKNTYVYADVERTSGANIDEDWRANVGVRFAF